MREALLKALAYYKYLGIPHVLQLGISVSASKSRDYLKELREDRKFTDRKINYTLNKTTEDQKTKVSTKRNYDLHYLTKKGVNFLIHHAQLNPNDIRYPKRPKQYITNDYHHRMASIAIHISFEQRIQQQNYTNRKALLYYRHNRNGRAKFNGATRLQISEQNYYTPDILLNYQRADQSEEVFCLEIYKGDRVNYASEQLKQLFRILDTTKKIEAKINSNAIPRILCVCENQSTIKGIKERLKPDPNFRVKHNDQLIFFNTEKNVLQNFDQGRENINGISIQLSQLKNIEL